MIAGRWHLLHVAQLVFANAIMYLYIYMKTTTSLYPLLKKNKKIFNFALTRQMEWSMITAYSSLVSYNLFFVVVFFNKRNIEGINS